VLLVACVALCVADYVKLKPGEKVSHEAFHQRYQEWRAELATKLEEHLAIHGVQDEATSAKTGRKLLWKITPTPSPVLGLITAFAPEVFEILTKMTAIKQLDFSGRRFYVGNFEGFKIVTVACGVGMTNAAMTTQIMIDRFPSVRYFIFDGIAGGVNPARRVGDVVMPIKWAQYQHQKLIRPEAGTFGFNDFNQDFPNKFYKVNGTKVSFTRPTCGGCSSSVPGAYAGFAIPMEVETLAQANDFMKPLVPSKFWFLVDTPLWEAAKKTYASKVQLSNKGLDPLTGQNFTLPYTPKFVLSWAGLASSTFVDNGEYRAQLYDTFKADVLDMESSAFMHVMASNRKSGIVLRSLSDLAGGEEDLNVILTFINFAAKNAVTVLSAFVKNIMW